MCKEKIFLVCKFYKEKKTGNKLNANELKNYQRKT